MPSKSIVQQHLMGMVHAYQNGELKNPSSKIKEMAKHISKDDVTHFAETKHKGLPNKVAARGDFIPKVLPWLNKVHSNSTAANILKPEGRGTEGARILAGDAKFNKNVVNKVYPNSTNIVPKLAAEISPDFSSLIEKIFQGRAEVGRGLHPDLLKTLAPRAKGLEEYEQYLNQMNPTHIQPPMSNIPQAKLAHYRKLYAIGFMKEAIDNNVPLEKLGQVMAEAGFVKEAGPEMLLPWLVEAAGTIGSGWGSYEGAEALGTIAARNAARTGELLAQGKKVPWSQNNKATQLLAKYNRPGRLGTIASMAGPILTQPLTNMAADAVTPKPPQPQYSGGDMQMQYPQEGQY